MSEHIHLDFEDGHVVVTIDDHELFDYVDDYLTEERDIEYEYVTKHEDGSRRLFAMHFPTSVSFKRVTRAVEELPRHEIERIWRLNNVG